MNKTQQVIINVFILIMCMIPMLNANEELTKKREEIQKEFINKRTYEVIKLSKDGKFLHKEFVKFLENDSSMVKIEQINKEGTGEFSLAVIRFSKNIKEDFENKENELFSNYKWANRKSDGSAVLGLAGGPGCIIFGVIKSEPIAIGAGVFATLGGLYGWYRYANQAEEISENIKEVCFMEEDWEQKFSDKLIKNQTRK